MVLQHLLNEVPVKGRNDGRGYMAFVGHQGDSSYSVADSPGPNYTGDILIKKSYEEDHLFCKCGEFLLPGRSTCGDCK